MKKNIAILLAILITISILASCGEKKPVTSEPETSSSTPNESSVVFPESSATSESSSTQESSEPEEPSFEALKFTTAPTIDGVITEEEWGTPLITFDQNTDLCYQDFHLGHTELSVTLWLRWDETYLYIGATSPEPDGQFCPSDEGENWNGDTLQIRVDPNGPNSTGDLTAPFDDTMINACFAMITSSGEMSKYDYTDVSSGDKTMPEAQFVYSLSEDNISTWEVAIKHSDICANYADRLAEIGEGFVYGISVARLNAAPDEEYNGWVSWGSGICGPQPAELCPGSNKLVLSAAPAV